MKTFVAPCVGGPLDGKLKRFDDRVETFLVPTTDGGAVQYKRVMKPDNSTIWQFATEESERLS